MLICCCCLGCGNGEKEIDDPNRPDRPDGDEYEDIEVVDGKVRFYLSESENGIRRPMGVGERVWNESKVTVNGKPMRLRPTRTTAAISTSRHRTPAPTTPH